MKSRRWNQDNEKVLEMLVVGGGEEKNSDGVLDLRHMQLPRSITVTDNICFNSNLIMNFFRIIHETIGDDTLRCKVLVWPNAYCLQ